MLHVSRERIEWRDLIVYRRAEIITELTLPLPWLALAFAAGSIAWYTIEFLFVLLVFTSGLRIAHGAYHRALGISARAGDVVMFCLSLLMGGSMHAIRFTHLAHHRSCLAPDDIKGQVATLGFWPALMRSPIYPILIHGRALRRGSYMQRCGIVAELLGATFVQLGIWFSCDSNTLRVFSLALLFANSVVAIPGIWLVHHQRGDAALRTRIMRARAINWLTFDMLYHRQHHLYPAVPACHLAVLARRLDALDSGARRNIANLIP